MLTPDPPADVAGPLPGAGPLPDAGPVTPAPAPIAGPPAPPADPTLPANQPPAAAAPAAPAPLGDNPVEDFKKTEADRAAAQAEADRAAAKAAEDEAKRKEHEAEVLRKQQEERDEHEAALNHTREHLAAAAEQAEQQVANHQFHDYASTRTTGQKWAILIGSILSGLGGGRPHEILDRAVTHDFEKQKAELASKENLAALKRQGLRDFDGYMRDQRLVLDHKEARAREALAAQMEAEAARSNNPVVIAKAQAAAAKVRQDAAAKLGEVEKTYAETQYTNARARLAAAKAAAARGGAGTSTVQDQLMQMAAKGGDNPENRLAMGRFAVKNGIKDAPSAVKKIFDDLLKPPKGEEFDEKLIVRNADGTAAGLATSARAVPQAQKDLRTYTRAIEQLKIARDYVEKTRLPLKSDPQFHNAVLAVAATTNANASDATTKHEEGTLTNFMGRPSTDAIDRKIDELTGTLNTIQNQLNPLPEGYSDKKKPAAPAGGDTGRASGYSKGTIVKQGGQKFRFEGGDQNDPKNYTPVN